MKEDHSTMLREAHKALGRLLGSSEGRDVLRHNGYDSSRRIKPILEDQPLDDLICDIRDNGAAVIAVYFPERQGLHRFEFLEFGDLVEDTVAEDHDAMSLWLGRNHQGTLSTVGMLCDTIRDKIILNTKSSRAGAPDLFDLPPEAPRHYSLV